MTNKQRFGSIAAARVGVLLFACVASATAWAGNTLDNVRTSGHLRLAYFPAAKPFTSGDASSVEGYGASLCGQVAARVKAQLGLSQLAVDWVPVTVDSAMSTVARGGADLLCTPANATLERRKSVAFSIPVFAGGIRAVVRTDASAALRDILESTPAQRNVWRGSPALTLLEKTTFATVAGTSSEKWLAGKVASFKLNTATVSVPDYATGIKFLQERKIDVFLAERDVVLAAMDDSARQNLRVLKRQLTQEPLALALPRGDDDFRLLVDSALSSTFTAPEFAALYSKYFGTLDDASVAFFAWVTPAP